MSKRKKSFLERLIEKPVDWSSIKSYVNTCALDTLLIMRPALLDEVWDRFFDDDKLLGIKTDTPKDAPIGIHTPVVFPQLPTYVPPPCTRSSVPTLDGTALEWQITIPQETYRKMWAFWMLHGIECSGLGIIKWDEEPSIYNPWNIDVVDLKLLSTQSTSAETTIDAEIQAEYIFELLDKNIDPTQARLWWHSHHSMAPFWSDTDVRAADSFCKDQAKLEDFGWQLSIVIGSKADKFDVLARVDLYEKDGNSIIETVVDEIPIIVPDQIGDSPEMIAMLETENMKSRQRGSYEHYYNNYVAYGW